MKFKISVDLSALASQIDVAAVVPYFERNIIAMLPDCHVFGISVPHVDREERAGLDRCAVGDRMSMTLVFWLRRT